MERIGTVVVFKVGVSKEEASEALRKIAHVIDGSYYVKGEPSVREFEDKDGGPVWYIP